MRFDSGTQPHDARAQLGAIDIAAPPTIVFSWWCQLRVAPYSCDVLDNLARRSPRHRTPGLAEPEVGQRFMFLFALRSFIDDEHITCASSRGHRARPRSWCAT